MRFLTLIIALIMLSCNKNNPELIKTESCSVGIFDNSLNNPKVIFSNDTLTISSGAKSDFFNAPDGIDKNANAPILMKMIDNTKPFTFTAKVKPNFADTYDAGAIYIFHNNDLWQKFAFEMDERRLTRLVTVRTLGTSDDNNHDAVSQDNVYMKVSSDVTSIGFYYSIDGENWQLVRLYRNEYPTPIYIGLSSQSPMSNGIDTQFSDIKLSDKSIQDFRLGL